MSKAIKKNALVCVHWTDACSMAGWKEDAAYPDTAPDWVKLETYGLLVKNVKDGIYLAMGVNKDNDYVTSMFIPRGMITKIKEVKK